MTLHALRFLTAGSVDDGKSTLIGRLLYDSRAILADQLEHLRSRAARPGSAGGAPDFDLSQLTDGLEAEREQGITIDVAYRYFATPRRKFIIADAPGHEQYTRNMVTAAAGSDAAVVLVDVTKLKWPSSPPADGTGVELLPQTRRHALLAQLLRVPHIVFAINKLDAVADPGAAFGVVRGALQRFASESGIVPAGIVPVSALRGDNVTQALGADWYAGPSLLALLEGLPASPEASDAAFGMPVQYVAPDAAGARGIGEQSRVIWGRLAQGALRPRDGIQVFPSGEQAMVIGLRRAGIEIPLAHAGESVGVVLDRQLDVSRGDWLAAPGSVRSSSECVATLAWLDNEPATVGRRYLLRHAHRWVQGRLAEVRHRLDIRQLARCDADHLGVNEIGEVRFEFQQPLPLAPYLQQRVAGALIVVDAASHRTSGALLVRQAGSDA